MATVLETTKGCGIKPALTAKPRTISVNGVAISRAAVSREAQNHPANSPGGALESAAQALVVRELLLQEARRIGITPEPVQDEDGRRETNDEALVRQLVEHEVPTPEPTEAECLRYYENNQSRFRSADLYEASHILVAASPDDAKQRLSALDTATAISRALDERPELFGDFVRTHSACPSRETKGSLGQIGPGQTVAEFEAALKRMEAGKIHPEPVETRYGFHIVRLERKIEGRQLPFDMVHARIAGFLAERVSRTALRQYVSLLAGRAKLEGIVLDASSTPLVQ